MSEKSFAINNPVMISIGKLGDIALLNFYFVICCLPIVTIGASITAMYSTTLKLVRGEEEGITKSFFNGFKLNFKQATFIWLVMLFLGIFLMIDFYLGHLMLVMPLHWS